MCVMRCSDAHTRRLDNLHIWLVRMISVMTLIKVSWSSPCFLMASWRALKTMD